MPMGRLKFSVALCSTTRAPAFTASLNGTSGGSTDNSGIFRGSGGNITQIARRGQAAPDANGTFSSFGRPMLNNSGDVAFWAF